MRKCYSPKLNTTMLRDGSPVGLAALTTRMVSAPTASRRPVAEIPDGKTPPAPTTVQCGGKIPFCRKRRSCHHYGHPHGVLTGTTSVDYRVGLDDDGNDTAKQRSDFTLNRRNVNLRAGRYNKNV